MAPNRGGKLGELLVSQGLVTDDQLSNAIEDAKSNKQRLYTSLVHLGHVNENVLATFLSKIYGIPAISLDNLEITDELKKIIPRKMIDKYGIVPVSMEGGALTIAISDPTNVAAVDDVRFLSNMNVNVQIAPESAIQNAIARLFDGRKSGADPRAMLDAGINARDLTGTDTDFSTKVSEAHAVDQGGETNKPAIRIINVVLHEAIKRGTSDVHLEPMLGGTRVRFRLDGALHEVMQIPNELKAAIPARVKVMASLDISEKRLPQDGRIQATVKDKRIDVRVSILPTIYGEKVVMRVLDQGDKTPTLQGMGFEGDQLEKFHLAAEQPYGMVLVTGPTGSGKSTTLFAALNELNDPEINISTVEDPVEYKVDGINQSQMHNSIGLTFASALRSLLRQDPDVIMVGEIRDKETAEISVKAALTGHMVFSTVHTNDAPSTISRLVHMGLEPFLITAALTLAQAQRLIRVNCTNCLTEDKRVTKEQILAAEMPENWLESFTPMKGAGCGACGNTGYKGRNGVFEVMPMSEALRDCVIRGASSDEIKKVAMSEGMITLRQSALMKFYRGETTLEEVLNNSRPDGDAK